MRREIITALLLSLALTASGKQTLPEIGYWQTDSDGLPAFMFTGALPSLCIQPDGKQANVPEDPWFILGNYRITVFPHVSGQYELISGEREWARMNQGVTINSGDNQSTIELLDSKGNIKKSIPLTGMDGVAADRENTGKTFGCGYARYQYATNGLKVERTLQVAPSTRYDNGLSAMLMTVKIRNCQSRTVSLRYIEQVGARYVPILYQRDDYNPVRFKSHFSVDGQSARCSWTASSEDPLVITGRDKMSMNDAYPPVLYLKALSEGQSLTADDDRLSASSEISLRKNQEITLRFVVGFTFDESDIANVSEKDFGTSWASVLPSFPEEEDKDLSRELVWDAYTLEAMATYSQYYKETKIPQGVIYDYYWGQHASARDNFQHALPLAYYNPELCKSVMRYMAKRVTPMGDIRLIEYGYGFAEHMVYCTSDQQLFFLQLIAEYLRITHDYAFLDEKVCYFPAEAGVECTMLEVFEKCFSYLRYTIGTGSHGLVRLLNSDWNDNIFVINKVYYNNVIFGGESMMNTTMAIAILQNLVKQLENVPQAGKLVESMRGWETKLSQAFLKDLGDRDFPRRMYFDGKAIGEDDMWLEPMGYMLQIQDLPQERKQRLYKAMQERVYSGEKLGARQQEAPQQEASGLEKGSRENGGFWYALNGPVVIGMKDVDRDEAWRLLKMMTFKNMSQQFPHYWTSYWSAADNQESSLMGSQEGLPDQSLDYWRIPIYCAHPHAWTLYCYYKLTEEL